jgi:curli biogenesis system outer membrane secretion channel CsgG
MMRSVIGLATLGVAVFAGSTRIASAQDAGVKPNIAIADVMVAPGGWTVPPPQMGSTIVELVVGELVESRQFHVYDGQWLVPQDEAGGGVNLAHLRAAAADRHMDYLVLGSVTAFSMVQQRSNGGAFVPLHTLAPGGAYTSARSVVAVDVVFRVVDVKTGEIVTTALGQGKGTRKSSGIGVLGFVKAIPLPFIGGFSRNVANARDAMLDEALRQAVHNAALALSKRPLPVTEHQ